MGNKIPNMSQLTNLSGVLDYTVPSGGRFLLGTPESGSGVIPIWINGHAMYKCGSPIMPIFLKAGTKVTSKSNVNAEPTGTTGSGLYVAPAIDM